MSARAIFAASRIREDGRSHLLFPTEKAEGLRNAKADAENLFYEYIMAGLGEAERTAFLSALDTLYTRSKEESRAGFPHIIMEEAKHEA